MRAPRRSRASQARYCGLALASVSVSTFNMDFELLPQRVEINVELGRVARGQGRRALCSRKSDRMVGLHPSWPARQHDHPLRHAHRFADIVGDKDRRLLLAAQVGMRMPEISDSSVLLPQPLWPMMATNSPGAIEIETSFNASVSPSRPK